jgi:hypothetical protein
MEKTKTKEFGLIFWVHAGLLIPAYLSPLLVSWKIILAGIVAVRLHYIPLKGQCIFTRWEFGKGSNINFVHHYLQKSIS